MEKRYDITTVGMINQNLAFAPVDRTVFDRDVTLIGPVVATPGGDAMNEALTAARLGSRVAILGRVGDDLFGRDALEQARRAGVDTAGVRVQAGDATAIGAMLVDAGGQRHIVANRGAFEKLCLADIDFAVVEDTRHLNIGSMLALKALDGSGATELLRRARAAGAITSADVKQDTYGIGFTGIRRTFPYLDYFLPSLEEAAYLSGEEQPQDQADFFLQAGCGAVIIKLGAEGCYVATGDMRRHVPACPARVVDTSGAGDNFVAGLLTGLSKGWALLEAVRFANATAAISIGAMGSNGAVRSFQQVLDYRKEAGY